MNKRGWKYQKAVFLILLLLIIIAVFIFYESEKTPMDEDVEDLITEPIGEEPTEPEFVEPEPYVSLLDGLDKESPFSSGESIGRLKIPVINLDMTVIENASASNLNRTLARMISSDLPDGKGNFVISGHRMYQYNSHFNRLDEVEIGDEIVFEDESYRYYYEVESITFVEPSEIWIMLGNNRESMLTLFTCTPIARATHRLVVFSSLKEMISLES
ncbi:MAG: class D sortase [Tindallia sp. MSAO_Bac2]|nr:MAG: class D sortase [Tindallia sp. MSAO_Bac2]